MLVRTSLCLFLAACAVAPDESDPEASTDSSDTSDTSDVTRAVAPVHITSAVAAWSSDAFIQGWDAVHDRVAFNRRGSDGGFDAYWSDRNGANVHCITCSLPGPANAQRGASDVHPSGNYVLATMEKPSHPGTIGDSGSEPGKGVYSDLYLVTADGAHQYALTNEPNDANHGVIWARFSHSGTKIVWSEMYAAPNIFDPKKLVGVWRLHLATLAWQSGVPHLANIQTYDPEPGNFYEPYGFSPDDTQILFASSLGMPGFAESQLYRVSTQLTNLTRLTDNVTNEPGWGNYNEFAFYLPDGKHIVVGRGREATAGGLDWWIMGADGSHAERLTYLNEAWHSQTHGYAVVGGWAIDPKDANHVLFAICTALSCSGGTPLSMELTPRATGNGTGLQGAYYADASLAQLAFQRTDPYVGFSWANAPNDLPAAFSVRWTGTLAGRTTGWHELCVYSDDGARLWLGSQLVIDAWHWQGPTQNCGWAWLGAATATPLKLEYFNGYGTNSLAKLSWTGPDRVQELVPTDQLHP